MAIYRTISMSFWTDSKVVDDFTPEDRYFYLYLFTNPHTNLCGCYEVSVKQMAYETGYSMDSINMLLKRFKETHDVLRYCEGTKELLLINWHKYNWTTSDKFRKPLLKEIGEIKCKEFREYLQDTADGKDGRYRIDTNCIDTTVTVTDNNSITNNINNNINNINNNSSTTSEDNNTKKKSSKKDIYIGDFERFWEAYPRKEGKGYAFECFKRARKESNADVDIMIEAINLYKQTEQWQEQNGKYIPQPSTWLNQKRWEDSPKVKGDKNNGENGGTNKWDRAAERVRERSGLL